MGMKDATGVKGAKDTKSAKGMKVAKAMKGAKGANGTKVQRHKVCQMHTGCEGYKVKTELLCPHHPRVQKVQISLVTDFYPSNIYLLLKFH